MNTPLVSVVVPTYNSEKWIGETLGSIADQSLDPELFEVLVVDNSSTDSTLEHVKKSLSGLNIRAIIASESNRGVAHARNRGVSLSQSEWISFLDSDDLNHSEKLETQIHYALNVEETVAAVYSDWQECKTDEMGLWVFDNSARPQIDDTDIASRLASLLSSSGFIPTGSSIYRRSAILEVGGYRDVGIIEDVDLNLRLIIGGWKFEYCASSEPLFTYRRHNSGSLSTNNIIAFYDGVQRNASMVESWARRHGKLNETLKEAIVGCYFQAARAFAGNDWKRFEVAVERLSGIINPVLPKRPRVLALTSRAIGYRAAERLAVSYRGIKRSIGLMP